MPYAFPGGASPYAPLRPPTERDMIHLLNGVPNPLGALVSTGTTVNNATTATPFAYQQTATQSLAGTLAGRVLLLYPSAAGFILSAPSAAITMATTQILPPWTTLFPGLPLAATTSVIITMPPNQGWLQWASTTGNLFVYELV